MWFKVDDSLPTHHRVMAAGNAAMGLWVRCGAWSMGQLTDGYVPTYAALMFGTQEEIDTLVRVGLWTEAEDGYSFFRWAEDGSGAPRQPTREQVESKRKADRERKQTAMDAARARKGSAGVASDSARNPSGGRSASAAESRPSSRNPDPTRPDPTSVLSPTSKEQNEGGADATVPPSAFCSSHPNGSGGKPCRACGDARRRRDDWTPPPPPPKPPAWDRETHCEHGQRYGKCDACAQEERHAAEVIQGHFGIGAA